MQNTNGRKVVGKRRKEREGELARKIWGKDTQSISITFQAFSSIFTPPITPAGTETIGPTYDIQTSEIQRKQTPIQDWKKICTNGKQ